MSVDVVVPSMGESVTTATIARWLKAPGDPVKVDEPIVELDSDKATMEVPAPAGGRLDVQLAAVGDEVRVGQVVARIAAGAVATAAPAAPAAAEPAADTRPAPAGPAVRQAAREAGLDATRLAGTGKGGRVTRADVEAAAAPVPAPVAVAAPVAAPVAVPVAPSGDEREDVVPMSTLRRRIAERLVEAQHSAAMLTTFNEIDMTNVLALRERYQDRFTRRYGIKLGFMGFFVKAAIEALKAFPAANAEIRGNDIVYKRYFHLGVAVSGPKGLVVPVLRNADRLSLAETEQAIAGFGQRVKEGTLSVDELRGGTFTISNGGVFGSLMSTPILNPPQVAILGMHAIQKRAVVITDAAGNDQIAIRPMMYVAVTYDHRLLDGREAVGFLVRIKECVENPERVLLEV